MALALLTQDGISDPRVSHSVAKTSLDVTVTSTGCSAKIDVQLDAVVRGRSDVMASGAFAPCAAALCVVLYGQTPDIPARNQLVVRSYSEQSRFVRGQANLNAGGQVIISTPSASPVNDQGAWPAVLTATSNAVDVHTEGGDMLNETELARRETIFKSTINATVIGLLGLFVAAAIGVVDLLALIPALLSAIGVIGSCGIQLRKVDACRSDR